MTNDELLLAGALNAWKTNIERADKMFAAATAEQLDKEIAPGKNRLIYLWGHLTAVHDRMLPLLEIGPRLHSELDVPFISNPDISVSDAPSADEVKKCWSEINQSLFAGFEKLRSEDWLRKHNAVSDEDFAKDRSRNRFAVLLSRTNHLAYHLGQVTLAPN
jgi:DinB family protein